MVFRKSNDFAPKSYDFAPNLPHQIITILHQILLRFRTKFVTISHQILTLISYDFAPNLLRFRTKSRRVKSSLLKNIIFNPISSPCGELSRPKGAQLLPNLTQNNDILAPKDLDPQI